MTIATNDSKPGIGKSGVHLRYHKHHKYKKLMHEQLRELSEWQQDNPNAHKPSHVKKPSHAKKPMQPGDLSSLSKSQCLYHNKWLLT